MHSIFCGLCMFSLPEVIKWTIYKYRYSRIDTEQRTTLIWLLLCFFSSRPMIIFVSCFFFPILEIVWNRNFQLLINFSKKKRINNVILLNMDKIGKEWNKNKKILNLLMCLYCAVAFESFCLIFHDQLKYRLIVVIIAH